MTGTVLFGINNIYTVLTGQREYLCRIKGKILKEEDTSYNPLAPGDRVVIKLNEKEKDTGMIISRLTRRNSFIRWNKKKQAPQTIAANLDGLLCISSIGSPPFRPRFIDRVLVSAAVSGIEAAVVLNKIDLEMDKSTQERLLDYEKMGVTVFRVSVVKNEGISVIKNWIRGKSIVAVGQSGVGKSSLLNILDPQHHRKTGDISGKYNRGSHTTCFSILHNYEQGSIIDTPGIREIDLYNITFRDLYHYFPDFTEYNGRCSMRNCLHVNEPDCGVLKALESGLIHPDRYESYLRIFYDLKEMEERAYG